ncbi:HD domain-containing protein [Candidatus Woesearchaeota archaeon]|jgi:hypothetical protein|nr:HD domain-containing protein [Candidatus Woesearchaeota archaeon]MBT7368828.1 HD domain-containing protein [Candidatus Woesearchaeota archaeon]
MTKNIRDLIEIAKQSEIMLQGLDLPYSPNHKGQTTKEHVEKQFNMEDSLCNVASIVNRDKISDQIKWELETAEALLSENYEKLHSMIDNQNVSDKPFLYTTKDDLQSFFDPLLRDLTQTDLRILTAVVALHDIGKVNQEWAKENLNTTGIEFIAHDYDSAKLVKTNPKLIAPFDLNDASQEIAIQLIKLHSLPGQYFFGEGNISGYHNLMNLSNKLSSENPMKLARIHGLIDVMSALNKGFVKPILNSHKKLSELISNVYVGSGNLADAFEQEAKHATVDFCDVLDLHEIHPNSLYRLIKLTATKSDEIKILNEALSELSDDLVGEFDIATRSPTTWFGTYVANAFGSGLRRAYGDSITDSDIIDVIQTTVKMIAGANNIQRQSYVRSYALSAITPGLMVADGQKEIIVDRVKRLNNLSSMVNYLNDSKQGFYVRRNFDTVEITCNK